MIKEVCGHYSTISTKVILDTAKRRVPYSFVYDGKTYARFDNEEMARLYQDAFQEGASVGYWLCKEELKSKPTPSSNERENNEN